MRKRIDIDFSWICRHGAGDSAAKSDDVVSGSALGILLALIEEQEVS